MNLKYYGTSKKGKKSQENEDNFLLPDYNEIYKITPNSKEKGHLFLLCDGMGGSNAGEVASQLCCGWFFKDYYENNQKIIDVQQWITDEIKSLNNRLFQLSNEYAEYSGMGTTIVSLLIKDNLAIVHNVGDSRLYLFRENKLRQITEDDSEVWKLYKEGYIEKDEIISNTRKHIITAAIATKISVKIHSEYKPIRIKKNDLFFLCSDGVTDVLVDSEIEAFLSKDNTLEEKAEEITNTAIKNRSKDDITIILIQALENSNE